MKEIYILCKYETREINISFFFLEEWLTLSIQSGRVFFGESNEIIPFLGLPDFRLQYITLICWPNLKHFSVVLFLISFHFLMIKASWHRSDKEWPVKPAPSNLSLNIKFTSTSRVLCLIHTNVRVRDAWTEIIYYWGIFIYIRTKFKFFKC